MKPGLLLLAATATIGAASPRPSAPRYWAGGFEPSWSFVIEHGRMIFDPHTGDPVINVPLPRRQPIRNGYRYDTRELFVTIRHVRCDSYDGRTFMDTVHPSWAVEAGCGTTQRGWSRNMQRRLTGWMAALTGISLAMLAVAQPGAAAAVTRSEYCSRLGLQLDGAIQTKAKPGASASQIAEATALQDKANRFCAERKQAQGIRTYANALKLLGVTPVDLNQ